jgi:hypothetical protein
LLPSAPRLELDHERVKVGEGQEVAVLEVSPHQRTSRFTAKLATLLQPLVMTSVYEPMSRG